MELKVKKCGNCGKKIVLMDTHTGSIIPVEVEDGKTYTDDDTFSPEVHTSHLLHCKAMQERWEDIKRSYLKIKAAKMGLTQKQLLR